MDDKKIKATTIRQNARLHWFHKTWKAKCHNSLTKCKSDSHPKMRKKYPFNGALALGASAAQGFEDPNGKLPNALIGMCVCQLPPPWCLEIQQQMGANPCSICSEGRLWLICRSVPRQGSWLDTINGAQTKKLTEQKMSGRPPSLSLLCLRVAGCCLFSFASLQNAPTGPGWWLGSRVGK